MKRVLAVVLVLGMLSFAGCATMSPEQERTLAQARMVDPQKSLWITVDSVPSGATVYGVNNEQPPTQLGTTPLTLKYTRVGGSIWGTRPDETLLMESRLSEPWSTSKAFLAFKCVILKVGYRPYHLYQVLEDRSGYGPFAEGNINSLDGGVSKTFTAFLIPIAPATPPLVGARQQ
jgi:hypothetical protein